MALSKSVVFCHQGNTYSHHAKIAHATVFLVKILHLNTNCFDKILVLSEESFIGSQLLSTDIIHQSAYIIDSI
jgi:hypothetical protein